jgi:hypothetical protein
MIYLLVKVHAGLVVSTLLIRDLWRDPDSILPVQILLVIDEDLARTVDGPYLEGKSQQSFHRRRMLCVPRSHR